MRLWSPRGVPPQRLKNPTNASRGTGQYLQLSQDDSLHMVYARVRTPTPADPDWPALVWSAGGVMPPVGGMPPAGFRRAGALLESECDQVATLTRRRRFERPGRSPSRRGARRSLLSSARRCRAPRPRLICSRDNVATSLSVLRAAGDVTRLEAGSSCLGGHRHRSASLTCLQSPDTDPRVVGALRLGKASPRIRLHGESASCQLATASWRPRRTAKGHSPILGHRAKGRRVSPRHHGSMGNCAMAQIRNDS